MTTPAPLQSPHPSASADATLHGVWLVAHAELAGWRLPSTARLELRLTIRGETFSLGGQRGRLIAREGGPPSALDFVTSTAGVVRRLPAIFEHHGDVLRICLDLAGHLRPREFLAPSGTRQFLATYRRAPRRRSAKHQLSGLDRSPSGAEPPTSVAPRSQVARRRLATG